MNIFIYGLNHEQADISLREKVAFTNSRKEDFYQYFLDEHISDLVILSTCNRSELIFVSDNLEHALNKIKLYYKNNMKVTNFENFNLLENKRALQYIFETVCGLHSLVIGEDQIQGQIKDAYTYATDVYECSTVFNKLFQSVLSCGKKVRSEHKLSEIPLSISYIAINLLKEKHNNLKDKAVLVVGVGKMNKLAIQYLLDLEVSKITLANRTLEKSIELSAKNNKIDYIPFTRRYDVIEQYDVIISATSAPHYVFEKHKLSKIDKQLIFLDMALPRDVEANNQHIIYDVDSLKKVKQANTNQRNKLALKAQETIDDQIDKFNSWHDNLSVSLLNKQLYTLQKEIIQQTLDFLDKKIELNLNDRKILNNTMNKMNDRLLIKPMSNLRKMDKNQKQQYQDMLEKLYQIGE
ncbi:glutamyl-tRNA reductase [Mycoplasma sp. P36-A1]|uniref:glutamyl-tRNA reductase n=1 Tax=Mycoplasma sp. P36-A1 TaxID=3252900 RepID=UPI003C2FBDBE